MTQISLLVVDGQHTFTDALVSRLEAEDGLLVVAAAQSAAATRRLVVGRHVDVVLLDSELPDALHLAAELGCIQATSLHRVRVIMLGAVPAATRIVQALRTGIAGWVSKDDSIEHLLDAIGGAMRGETWLPVTAVGPVLQLLLDEHQQEAARHHPLAKLTPREREVLMYLADGVGRREVAERMHLSANTVRSHLQSLMGKLKVHSSLEAVALARRAPLPEPHSGLGPTSQG